MITEASVQIPQVHLLLLWRNSAEHLAKGLILVLLIAMDGRASAVGLSALCRWSLDLFHTRPADGCGHGQARAAGVRCGDGVGAGGRKHIQHLINMGAVSLEEAMKRCPTLQVRPMRTGRYRQV